MLNKKWALIAGRITILLMTLQIVIGLVSWIVNAAWPDAPVRSLLSGEGIRWFIGHFVDILQTPLLVWIILLAIAWGTYFHCGLGKALVCIIRGQNLSFRDRMGIRLVTIEVLAFALALILLTLIPHAILLSITGSLFPSSFSNALIPIISFIVVLCSVSYGYITGRISSSADLFRCITIGIERWAWVFPLYVLIAQVVESARFIFGV